MLSRRYRHRYRYRRRRRSMLEGFGFWRILCLTTLVLPLFWQNPLPNLSWRFSIFSEWVPPRARHPVLMRSFKEVSSSEVEPADLWDPPSSNGWRKCLYDSRSQSFYAGRTGYLQVFLEGGLNQQRMGICDAIALAKILNTTLVLPHLDVNPVWQDTSSFADIFDLNHFLLSLAGDVHIVTELPEELQWSTREYYGTGIRATRVKDAPVRASPSWYIANVLPIINGYGIAAIAPFSHRLAFEGVPVDIQQLRCKVNFQALRFVSAITNIGDLIIYRLQKMALANTQNAASKTQLSKFLALHLRFDKDMAAHSACDFGGGKAEQMALEHYRNKVWQGRVPNLLYPMEQLWQLGKCPLTPEQVGLLLAAIGFSNSTTMYLASYKVYGGESRMSYLRDLYPLLKIKDDILTSSELKPFKGKASLLAAIDYHVSLQSDFFLSASPGNMHNALIAHRTFEGVRKTLKPDMILLAKLFSNDSMEWQEFKQKVRDGHKNRMGQVKLRQPRQSLYTYPAPDCMCIK